MAKAYTDKKLQLGEPLATRLRDFCAANYNCSALDVVREAVEGHIKSRLENPEMAARVEAARRKRLGVPETIVQFVKKEKAE
jgi:hypothetical protein